MRNKMQELLHERQLSKSQMARDLDVSTQYLSLIIKGKQDGGWKFWRNFQQAYNISNEEIELYKQKG